VTPQSQLVRDVVWEPLAGAAPERPTPTRPDATTDAAEELFARLARFLATAKELASSSDRFPWGALDRLLQEATATLARGDDLFWVAHRPVAPAGIEYLAFHQARVAVLALRLGGALGYEGRRLGELGMAACLADVGLWQMPATAARHTDPLSSQDHDLFRTHPRAGAALIRRWTPPSDVIVEAVAQHHEREQGQGYPQGLRGPAVHPDAKIVGLADTYAALTAPAPPRLGRPPHEAIREIVRSRHRAFDPVLIKALLGETSLFPPGTLVRVSSGEIGRVIAPNRKHPLRPRIELLVKASGMPRVLDLVEAPFVYITGPIAT
jgi:HD-GYP domain-containing protein (c-di-GMP phosphodiesterase class II)